jgi:hypothetical protein
MWIAYWGCALVILVVLIILTQYRYPILAGISMGIFCALILGALLVPGLLDFRRQPTPELTAEEEPASEGLVGGDPDAAEPEAQESSPEEREPDE